MEDVSAAPVGQHHTDIQTHRYSVYVPSDPQPSLFNHFLFALPLNWIGLVDRLLEFNCYRFGVLLVAGTQNRSEGSKHDEEYGEGDVYFEEYTFVDILLVFNQRAVAVPSRVHCRYCPVADEEGEGGGGQKGVLFVVVEQLYSKHSN